MANACVEAQGGKIINLNEDKEAEETVTKDKTEVVENKVETTESAE